MNDELMGDLEDLYLSYEPTVQFYHIEVALIHMVMNSMCVTKDKARQLIGVWYANRH